MNGPHFVRGVYCRKSYTLEHAYGYTRDDRVRPQLRIGRPYRQCNFALCWCASLGFSGMRIGRTSLRARSKMKERQRNARRAGSSRKARARNAAFRDAA